MKSGMFQKVPIDSIDPNPHRDFKVSPIDDEHVDRLVDDYASSGDFGSLPVRRHPDKKGRYQLVGGHHRLKAMKKSNVRLVDVKVNEYDDKEMLDAMISENGGQDKKRFSVVVEAVAATMRDEAYRVLSSINIENRSERKLLDLLLSGEGIGEGVVSKRINRRFSNASVREAIAQIKKSELHLTIMKRVDAGIVVQFPNRKSEQRLNSTKMLAAISLTEPTFNSEVTAKFEKASHATAARKELEKAGIDPDKQVALLDETLGKAGKRTAAGIRKGIDAASGNDDQPQGDPADVLAEAKARYERASVEHRAARLHLGIVSGDLPLPEDKRLQVIAQLNQVYASKRK